ncbi:hypothetical protein ACPCUF_29525 [Streptomyces griseoincarnatus]
MSTSPSVKASRRLLGAVEVWALRHSLLPRPRHAHRTAAQVPAHGRWRRLPLAAPHSDQTVEATLCERSCLPWRIGELITTELAPAPGGWRLGGRA